MSLIYCDGFDHYQNTAGTDKGWSNNFSSMQTGRLGGQCARLSTVNPSAANTQRTLPSSYSKLWLGFAYRINTWSGSNGNDFATLRVGGTNALRLSVNASQQLQVRNSGGTVIGTGTHSLSTSTWYYIELMGNINGASGSCQLWLNGVEEIAETTGNFGSSNLSGISIGYLNGSGVTAAVDIDDLYVTDTAGPPNNSQLGDVRIEAVYPTSDGANIQWTPSTGSDHYALVDEASGTFPNDDTDYISDSVSGHVDEYNFGAPSGGGSVFAIQTCIYARKDDAGTRQIADIVRQSGTDTPSAAQSLSIGYLYVTEVHETDPAGSAWTLSTVPGGASGVQVGVKVI